MKITCQSCQSKYTVSDEKVQGKTVKIKCRKCGATILVNSGGVTTSAPADPVSLSAGGQSDGGASYLVNVTEGDQRSMTLPEIVAAYQTSVVNAETYVWADGMSDWQPLGQVEAIVAALHSQSAPPPAAEPSAPAMAAVAAVEAEPRAAARRDARPAQDVFSAKATDVGLPAPPYSNGSAASAARSVPAATPSKPMSEENSMLFSLSALTAKAPPAAAAPKHTTARDREDSGIIDLKALAAAASAQSSAPAAPAAAAFLPDGGLFPLGAPPVGAPAAAPPVVAPSIPPPKSKTPLFLGIGGVVAVGAIVGAFLIMKGSPPPPPPPAPAAAETASAAPSASASAAPAPSASAEASAAPSAVASAAPSADAKAGKGGKAGGKAGGPVAGKAAAPASPGGAAPPPAAPAAPAGPKKGSCGCAPGDLMCAMKCSAGK
jgi:predicted Zn finger-like uncharacterized protein